MEYEKEPLYIDDILSITKVNGYISCVKFDKEIISVKFYDRDIKNIIIPRKPNELICVSLSIVGDNKANIYLSVIEEYIKGYATSICSANMIFQYYTNYNNFIKENPVISEVENHEYEIQNSLQEKQCDNETDIIPQIKAYLEMNNKQDKPQKDTNAIIDINEMSGYDFETYVGKIFKDLGYNVTVTQKSNDQGIDIIASNNLIRIGIQAKRYSDTVGNSAVQEAVAGKAFYNYDKVIVVTNSTFSKSAVELAISNNVGLIDGLKLSSMISDKCDTTKE